MIKSDYGSCTLCPRECKINRNEHAGICGGDAVMRVAKIMLHRYEEPPISGTRGSGAIFFRGCNLRCGYCQNAAISHGSGGVCYSPQELASAMLDLQDKGTHNINLVTAAHYLPQVVTALKAVKPNLKIPVVYNSSGYEKAEALRELDGLVDIYLPDFKYADGELAKRYSGAEDYPQAALAAIAEMVRQTGEYIERDGLAVRGTVIRHLVLPSHAADSEKVMRIISENFSGVRVSIMRQYTPEFNRTGDPNLDRKVTSYEYNRVVNAAVALNLDGFIQYGGCENSSFTPDF